MKTTLIITAAVFLLTGCGKEYACVCEITGDEKLGTYKGTKKKADKECGKLSTSATGSVPGNKCSAK